MGRHLSFMEKCDVNYGIREAEIVHKLPLEAKLCDLFLSVDV